MADTNNVIGFAIGAMFVREVFHGEAKPQGMKSYFTYYFDRTLTVITTTILKLKALSTV